MMVMVVLDFAIVTTTILVRNVSGISNTIKLGSRKSTKSHHVYNYYLPVSGTFFRFNKRSISWCTAFDIVAPLFFYLLFFPPDVFLFLLLLWYLISSSSSWTSYCNTSFYLESLHSRFQFHYFCLSMYLTLEKNLLSTHSFIFQKNFLYWVLFMEI